MTDAFSSWLDALEIPTETIELCTDHRLVAEAARLHTLVEAEKDSDAPAGALGDTSPADELAQVREKMRAKTISLVVHSPSEDDMLGLEKLRESDPEAWAAGVIAAASHEPKLTVAQVKQMRGKLDRGTWNDLFRRVLDIAVNRSLTIPFSWADSESDPD